MILVHNIQLHLPGRKPRVSATLDCLVEMQFTSLSLLCSIQILLPLFWSNQRQTILPAERRRLCPDGVNFM